MSLAWRDAGRRDRRELQSFICADPPGYTYDPHRGRHHPQLYALRAQGLVRDLRPPVDDPDAILVGHDDDGLAAVVAFGFDPSDEQFVIQAVARAQRCTRRGYGRAAIEQALTVLAAHKLLYSLDCGVFTRIHPDNAESKAAFGSLLFEPLGVYEGMETWVRDI
ncbi:hypothetical protein GCM10009718_32790 [Isoptericola halotolerans]|uniref:Acetyltransferase (GNAT) family protein n=1 Tax=Isoptericola halotolerans TaxID=300560 RepID=A0ABX2A5N6_9MICO|nr:hypothetical protein [Isoptericola halotolerans]NOV98167.1 hypothetical protein [Isoptericola halotolerans]